LRSLRSLRYYATQFTTAEDMRAELKESRPKCFIAPPARAGFPFMAVVGPLLALAVGGLAWFVWKNAKGEGAAGGVDVEMGAGEVVNPMAEGEHPLLAALYGGKEIQAAADEYVHANRARAPERARFRRRRTRLLSLKRKRRYLGAKLANPLFDALPVDVMGEIRGDLALELVSRLRAAGGEDGYPQAVKEFDDIARITMEARLKPKGSSRRASTKVNVRMVTATIRKGPDGIGLGIVVGSNEKKSRTLVKSIMEELDAISIVRPEGASLGVGDELVGIGQEKIKGWGIEQVTGRLRDVPEDGTVTLTFAQRVEAEIEVVIN
jgi:hypothetical protein